MIIDEKSMDMLYPPPPPYTQIASTWSDAPQNHSQGQSQSIQQQRQAAYAPSTSTSNAEPALSRSNTVHTSVTTSPSLSLSHPLTGRGLNPLHRTEHVSLSSLPSHLLLQIFYTTFPQMEAFYGAETKVEKQRENLFWLETSLRLVNKGFYTVCMHILRSTYLPAYDSFVKRPYTSDPFPSSSFGSTSITSTTYRELRTLDQFIALLAFEDVLLDSSSLVLPREEAYKDLFELLQPKSRLEDLIREEGVRKHLVWVDDDDSSSEPPPFTSTPPPSIPPSHSSEVATESVVTSDDGRTIVLQPPSPSSSPPPSPLQKTPTSPSGTLIPSAGSTPSPSPTRSSFSSFMSSAKAKAKQKLQSRPKTLKNGGNLSPSPYPYPHPDQIPLPSGCSAAVERSNVSRQTTNLRPIPFSTLSVSFTSRKVALLYAPESSTASHLNAPDAAFNGSTFGSLSLSAVSHGRHRPRTLFEISRTRDERLEDTAWKVIRELRAVMEEEMQ